MKVRLLSPSLTFREFYHALVEGAPDAIIYADISGIIHFWNHGAERIFDPAAFLGELARYGMHARETLTRIIS